MGRRGKGMLFGEEPEESALPASDEVAQETTTHDNDHGEPAAAIAESGEQPAAERGAGGDSVKRIADVAVAVPPAPPKKQKLKPKDGEKTARDHVRALASRRLETRIRKLDLIAAGKYTPTKFEMDALLAMNELAIDKTPTAQPIASKRSRILVGRVGETRNNFDLHPGGDNVVPAISPPPPANG